MNQSSKSNYFDQENQEQNQNNKVYAAEQQVNNTESNENEDEKQKLKERLQQQLKQKQQEQKEKEKLEERKRLQEEQSLGNQLSRCCKATKEFIVDFIQKLLFVIIFYADLTADVIVIIYFAINHHYVYLGFLAFFVGMEVLYRIIDTISKEKSYPWTKGLIELIQMGYLCRIFMNDSYRFDVEAYNTMHSWIQSTPSMYIVTFAIFYSDLQETLLYISFICSFISNIHSNINYFQNLFVEYDKMVNKRKLLFAIILIAENFSRVMLWGLLCYTTKPVGIWVLVGINFFLGIVLAFSKLCNQFAAFYDQFLCFKFFEDLILDPENNTQQKYIQIRDIIIQIQNFVLIGIISANFSIIEKSILLYYILFLISIVCTTIVLTYMLFRWLFSEDKGLKQLLEIKELKKELAWYKSKLPKAKMDQNNEENEEDEQYAMEMKIKSRIDDLNKQIKTRDEFIKNQQHEIQDMEKGRQEYQRDAYELKERQLRTEIKLKDYISKANILQSDLENALKVIELKNKEIDEKLKEIFELQEKNDQLERDNQIQQNKNTIQWKKELGVINLKQEQSSKRFNQLEEICRQKQKEIKKLSSVCVQEKSDLIEQSQQMQEVQEEKKIWQLKYNQLEDEVEILRKKEHLLLDQQREFEIKQEYLQHEVLRLKATIQEQQEQEQKDQVQINVLEDYEKNSNVLMPLYNIKALASKSLIIDNAITLKGIEKEVQGIILTIFPNEDLLDILKEKQKQLIFIRLEYNKMQQNQMEVLKQITKLTLQKSKYLKALSINLSEWQKLENQNYLEISNFISNLTQIYSLELNFFNQNCYSGVRLDLQYGKLFNKLQDLHRLECLHLELGQGNIPLVEENLVEVGELIVQLPFIKDFYLGLQKMMSTIQDTSFIKFTDSLAKCKNLNKLHLNLNEWRNTNLSDIALYNLSFSLINLFKLQTIQLQLTYFMNKLTTYKSIDNLFDGLSKIKNLKMLILNLQEFVHLYEQPQKCIVSLQMGLQKLKNLNHLEISLLNWKVISKFSLQDLKEEAKRCSAYNNITYSE